MKRVAYHEAGHAVMSALEHVPFCSVTIASTEHYAGRLQPGNPPEGFLPEHTAASDFRSRRRVEARVRVCLAGEVAERILAGSRMWRLPRVVSSRPDFAAAMDLLHCLTDVEDTLNAHLQLLYLQARDTLKIPHNLTCVEAVAEALIECRTLSARRVRSIRKETLERWLAARTSRKDTGEA